MNSKIEHLVQNKSLSLRTTNYVLRTGFTLIELLLSLALFSAIILIVSTFFTFVIRDRVKERAIAEVSEQGAFASALVTQTLRNGKAIATPPVGGSGGTLSITTYDSLTNPTNFYVSNQKLFIKEGVGAAVELTSGRVHVTSVLFRNLSRTGTPGTARAEFVLESDNPTGKNEYSFTQIFHTSGAVR